MPNHQPVIVPQGVGVCHRCGGEDTVHGPAPDAPCYCQRCLDRADRHIEMFVLAVKIIGVLTAAAFLLKVAVERMH